VDAKNRTTIRDSGGIDKLIQCLLDESIELRQNAADVLCDLAWDAKNKEEIKEKLESSGHKLKRPWFPWGKFNIIIKKDSNNRV
jgi:hypothetical protein